MNNTVTQKLRNAVDWYEKWQRKLSSHINALTHDDYPLPTLSPSRTEPTLVSNAGLDEAYRQLAFTFAVIALGAKLAAVDGSIKQEEFSAFCALFPMPDEEHPKIQRLFFMANNDPNPFTHYAKQLAGLFPNRQSLKDELVSRLCKLAEADGRATLAERRMITDIAALLEVKADVIQQSLSYRFDSSKNINPYQLLGVAEAASNIEVKLAYRNRVRTLHPDRLTAEGYAQEDIVHAEAELMAVNEAYLILARKRKIK